MNGVLSYKDWLKSEAGNNKLPNPYQSYLDYINSWYETSYNGKSTEELTADEYRNFLLTLKNVSSDPEILSYIDNLDYDDLDQIQTAIPYFAKNLKLMASELSKNRTDSKSTNNTYNYSNSNRGLELEVYKGVLNLFSISTDLSGGSFLDSVKATSISIEELFNDNEYLDKDPDIPASGYFDASETASLFGLDSSYLDWAIESGFNDLYSNNDILNPETEEILPISGYINFELSGTSVDYYRGNLGDALMGEAHYYLSGDDLAESVLEYSSASKPWSNLSNRYYPTVATVPLLEATHPVQNIGGFFIPSKLAMPVALGRNKFYNIDEMSLDGIKLEHFPDGLTYSDGYTFTKTLQDSYKPFNSYLNWIDIKQLRGDSGGILSENGKHQEMIPYQTSFESTQIPYLGMDRVGDKNDPWYLSEDKVWRDGEQFPPDFRNIHNVAEWYNSAALNITGYLDQWAIDIYGNNYALYKETNSQNMYSRMNNSSGNLYIRSVDGTTEEYADYFDSSLSGGSLSGFNFGALKNFNVYADLIVMEDLNDQVAIQKIELDSTYKLDEISLISTLNIETAGEYKSLGYFFDDRDQTLYVGRYAVGLAGTLDFIIYKYEEGKLISIYNTLEDESEEWTEFKSTFEFNNITSFPSMVISTLHNKLFVTYIGHIEGEDKYIVNIPLLMEGGFAVDEIIVVIPETPETPENTLRSTESLRLLNTTVSEDNLILFLEGRWSNGKYLQCIPFFFNGVDYEVTAPIPPVGPTYPEFDLWDIVALGSETSYTITELLTGDDDYDVSLSIDGTQMYAMNRDAEEIYQYELDTPFVISSGVSYVGVGDISGPTPNGMFFSYDGKELYIADDAINGVTQFTLGTAWDITTVSYTSQKDLSLSFSSGISMKADGTLLFISDGGGDSVFEYTLATPYLASSIQLPGTEHTLTAVGGESYYDIEIKQDGSRLILLSWFDYTIYQFDLGTDWDLGSAVYNGVSWEIPLIPQNLLTGIHVPYNGNYVYGCGDPDDNIYRMEM